MVTSFFPGRIRLRDPIFKDAVITARALSILKKPVLSALLKGVEHNPSIGSVLITYHPLKVPTARLESLVPLVKKLEREVRVYSEKNKSIILSILDELEAAIENLVG